MQQTRHLLARADHGIAIGRFAFDTAPRADQQCIAQRGQQRTGVAHHSACRLCRRLRIFAVTMTASTADHAVAALDLARVDTAADHAEVMRDEAWQRLRHPHVRVDRLHRYGLAEKARHRIRPRAGAVDQPVGGDVLVARMNLKARAVVCDVGQRRLLAHDCARPLRRTRKGGRHEARVRVSVAHAQRSAKRRITEPRIALAKRRAAHQFGRESMLARHRGPRFEHGEIAFAPRKTQMSRHDEFSVDADQFGQAVPDVPRAHRKRQLLGGSALASHAAVVDATRLCAAVTPLEQADAHAAPRERERCGRSDQSAARNHDLIMDSITHRAPPRKWRRPRRRTASVKWGWA